MYRQTSSSLGFSSLSASTTASAMASANITSPRCWQTNAVPSAPTSNLKLSFSPDQFDRSRLFDGAPKADVDPPLLLHCSPRAHEGPASLGHTRWHTPRKRNLSAPQICTRRAQSPGHQPETLLNIRTYSNISIHDAVYALVWRTVMAARLKISTITATDNVTFGNAN